MLGKGRLNIPPPFPALRALDLQVARAICTAQRRERKAAPAGGGQAQLLPQKRPRIVVREPMHWESVGGAGVRIEIAGDSALIINWVNGLWKCQYAVYDSRLSVAHRAIAMLVEAHDALPRHCSAEWARHVYRELNAEADELANRHYFKYQQYCSVDGFRYFRIYFDGSVSDGGAGGGWVLYGSRHLTTDAPEDWSKIADLSFGLRVGATVTAAELEACVWAIAYLGDALQDPAAANFNPELWQPMDTSRLPILSLAGMLDVW